MKKTTIAVSILSLATVAAVLVTKVSDFPQVVTPGDNDFFLLALTNSPATNNAIKYSNLRASIRSNVTESAIVLADVTTLNASTSKHGFLSKLSGNTNNYISGNGTEQLAGGGSGSGVSTVVTPLAYSGTNVTGFDCTTNNATFTLMLTNHCLFNAASFTGLPNTTTNMFFTLGLQQNSAGGWAPKWTNSIVTWAEGVQPVINTNANAVSYVYFHTHLFTNGMLVGTPNINVK